MNESSLVSLLQCNPISGLDLDASLDVVNSMVNAIMTAKSSEVGTIKNSTEQYYIYSEGTLSSVNFDAFLSYLFLKEKVKSDRLVWSKLLVACTYLGNTSVISFVDKLGSYLRSFLKNKNSEDTTTTINNNNSDNDNIYVDDNDDHGKEIDTEMFNCLIIKYILGKRLDATNQAALTKMLSLFQSLVTDASTSSPQESSGGASVDSNLQFCTRFLYALYSNNTLLSDRKDILAQCAYNLLVDESFKQLLSSSSLEQRHVILKGLLNAAFPVACSQDDENGNTFIRGILSQQLIELAVFYTKEKDLISASFVLCLVFGDDVKVTKRTAVYLSRDGMANVFLLILFFFRSSDRLVRKRAAFVSTNLLNISGEEDNEESLWLHHFVDIYHQIESCSSLHMYEQLYAHLQTLFELHTEKSPTSTGNNNTNNNEKETCVYTLEDAFISFPAVCSSNQILFPCISFEWLQALLNVILSLSLVSIKRSMFMSIVKGQLKVDLTDKVTRKWIVMQLIPLLDASSLFPPALLFDKQVDIGVSQATNGVDSQPPASLDKVAAAAAGVYYPFFLAKTLMAGDSNSNLDSIRQLVILLFANNTDLSTGISNIGASLKMSTVRWVLRLFVDWNSFKPNMFPEQCLDVGLIQHIRFFVSTRYQSMNDQVRRHVAIGLVPFLMMGCNKNDPKAVVLTTNLILQELIDIKDIVRGKVMVPHFKNLCRYFLDNLHGIKEEIRELDSSVYTFHEYLSYVIQESEPVERLEDSTGKREQLSLDAFFSDEMSMMRVVQNIKVFRYLTITPCKDWDTYDNILKFWNVAVSSHAYPLTYTLNSLLQMLTETLLNDFTSNDGNESSQISTLQEFCRMVSLVESLYCALSRECETLPKTDDYNNTREEYVKTQKKRDVLLQTFLSALESDVAINKFLAMKSLSLLMDTDTIDEDGTRHLIFTEATNIMQQEQLKSLFRISLQSSNILQSHFKDMQRDHSQRVGLVGDICEQYKLFSSFQRDYVKDRWYVISRLCHFHAIRNIHAFPFVSSGTQRPVDIDFMKNTLALFLEQLDLADGDALTYLLQSLTAILEEYNYNVNKNSQRMDDKIALKSVIDQIFEKSWETCQTMEGAAQGLAMDAFIELMFNHNFGEEQFFFSFTTRKHYYDQVFTLGKNNRPHLINKLTVHLFPVLGVLNTINLSQWVGVMKDLILLIESETPQQQLSNAEVKFNNDRNNEPVIVRLVVLDFLESIVPHSNRLIFVSQLVTMLMDADKQFESLAMLGSPEFKMRKQLWEALCVLSPMLDERLTDSDSFGISAVDRLKHVCQPHIRMPMEIFVANIAKKRPNIVIPAILVKLTEAHDMPQQVLASYMIVLGHVIFDAQSKTRKKLLVAEAELIIATEFGDRTDDRESKGRKRASKGVESNLKVSNNVVREPDIRKKLTIKKNTGSASLAAGGNMPTEDDNSGKNQEMGADVSVDADNYFTREAYNPLKIKDGTKDLVLKDIAGIHKLVSPAELRWQAYQESGNSVPSPSRFYCNKTLDVLIEVLLPWIAVTSGYSRAFALLLLKLLIPMKLPVVQRYSYAEFIKRPDLNAWVINNEINTPQTRVLLEIWKMMFRHADTRKCINRQIHYYRQYALDNTKQSIRKHIRESRGENIAGEGLPDHLLDIIGNLVKLSTPADSSMPPISPLNTSTATTNNGSSNNNNNKSNRLPPLQRKIIPYDELKLGLDDYVRSRGLNSAGRYKQSVVVCASLVDKSINLAGLSRTGEIFAIEELVVPDMKLTKTDAFKSVAVSSDGWIPMREVKKNDCLEYLQMMKQQGYTIIGLEQTDSSAVLSRDLALPSEKVVLLLGAEKTGIPVELLQEVDQCVEIQQFGLTRSLNVHVSAALLIWEFSQRNVRNEVGKALTIETNLS